MGIGWGEWLIILLVVLLVFGAGKLPEVGRALGEGVRNLKKGLSADAAEDERPRVQPPTDANVVRPGETGPERVAQPATRAADPREPPAR